MTLKEMEERLESLKKQKIKIDEEISSLEKEIKETKKKSNKFADARLDPNNKKLFLYYCLEVKKTIKMSTYNDYCSALKNMKEMLEEKHNLQFDYSFVEIDDPILFNKLIELFENTADLVAENRRRHHDISAAYNNYYQFLLSKRG